MEACPRLPARRHIIARDVATAGPDFDAWEKRRLGHYQVLLGGHHCLPGEADFRALSPRNLQALGQGGAGFRRGQLQVMNRKWQGGVTPHDVVQLGGSHELGFLRLDVGIAAFRQVHLSTQQVVGGRHSPCQQGVGVFQG